MPAYNTIRQKLMDEYTSAGVAPSDVWLQSFVEQDVMYWLAASPAGFGPQAVMLDNNYTDGTAGVKILAPPMQMLVKVGA